MTFEDILSLSKAGFTRTEILNMVQQSTTGIQNQGTGIQNQGTGFQNQGAGFLTPGTNIKTPITGFQNQNPVLSPGMEAYLQQQQQLLNALVLNNIKTTQQAPPAPADPLQEIITGGSTDTVLNVFGGAING